MTRQENIKLHWTAALLALCFVLINAIVLTITLWLTSKTWDTEPAIIIKSSAAQFPVFFSSLTAIFRFEFIRDSFSRLCFFIGNQFAQVGKE